MFDWFSLDVIYYPVSGIMWLWYKLFALILGPTNFFSWALSVMFLVFTLRALLYKPFVKQIRTTRQMQELQPQIKALQKKYGKDRQRMALEMQKLQRGARVQSDPGLSPHAGADPGIHRSVSRADVVQPDTDWHRLIGLVGRGEPQPRELCIQRHRWSHFLDANLFGAPLGATMIQQHGLDAFTVFSRPAVIAVAIPLMLLAGIATPPEQSCVGGPSESGGCGQPSDGDDEQTRPLYLSPGRRDRRALPPARDHPVLGVQQHLDLRSAALRVRNDREREKKDEAIARRAANAPALGASPRGSGRTRLPALRKQMRRRASPRSQRRGTLRETVVPNAPRVRERA